MRYIVIVAALVACGPATAGDADCGSNPNDAVGFECMVRKFGGILSTGPNSTFFSTGSPYFEAFPEPTIVGIGVGAIRSYMLGTNVIAVGRCAGASLVKGSDVILLGDYTAAPRPETSHYINWRNETCVHYGVVVKCPPPEPECVK